MKVPRWKEPSYGWRVLAIHLDGSSPCLLKSRAHKTYSSNELLHDEVIK